jgi:hypothetical protein
MFFHPACLFRVPHRKVLVILSFGASSLAATSLPARAGTVDESLFSGASEMQFDSALQLGMGVWSAPALPQLVEDGGTQRFNLADYDPIASGLHLHLETQLFFPVALSGLPLGLTMRSNHLISESSAFSFTVSGDKTQERPRQELALMVGARADYRFAGIAVNPGLEVYFRRTIYLNARATSWGPLLSVQLQSLRFFPVLGQSGLRPIVLGGFQLCPYLMHSGTDKRGHLDSWGVPGSFNAQAQLADTSSALYFAFHAEVGTSWVDKMKDREHILLLGWSGQFTQHSGLIERTDLGQVSRLDVNESAQSFYLSLRSLFL